MHERGQTGLDLAGTAQPRLGGEWGVGLQAQASTVTEENSPMRTRAGWIALVLTGSMAVAPSVVRAQQSSATQALGTSYNSPNPNLTETAVVGPTAPSQGSYALTGFARNPGANLPPVIRAQDGYNELDMSGRDQPTVPLPISSSRPESGGFYTAIEFSLYRQPRNLAPQIIARRGLVDDDGSIQADLGGTWMVFGAGSTPVFVPGAQGAPGTFLGSGTPALLASDLNSARTYQAGFTYTLGWKFSDGTAFEFSWLHLQPAVYSAGASILPPGHTVGPALVDTFLFSPVYNFPNNYAGEAQKLSLGNPGAAFGIWNGAGSEWEYFRQHYDQGDWTVRTQVRNDPISRTYVTAGGRFAWIWEGYQWRTVSQTFDGQSGPQDVAVYSNDVSNRMYGMALGVEQEIYLGSTPKLGAWAISFHGDFAPLLDVVKERVEYALADRSTANKKAVTTYTFAPELNGNIKLAWYPINGVEVKFSWNSMAFFNTVHTYNPVSFDFGNLGKVNDFGPLPGGAPPSGNTDSIWIRKAIYYFDGINFGVSVHF